jgi:predicted RecB family nuclease
VYLDVHHPDWASPPDPSTQAMLDMGTEIGERARSRFPGGVLIGESYRQREAALAHTASVIADVAVPAVFEGAFLYDGVLVRVDILERIGSGPGEPPAWRLIEVKSSSRVKNVHLDDLAIQRYVLQGAGLQIAAACLMHLNAQYVFRGDRLDLDALFTVQDVSELVAARGLDVPNRLAPMQQVVLQQEPPPVEPDDHCHTPYECPYWAHCTKDKPARWIYHLPGSAKHLSELVRQGVTTIDDIPNGVGLSTVQRRVKDDAEWISPKLREVLASVQYPVHHLDFETIMPGIPCYPDTRPYESIPVQWSIHIEDEPGRWRHEEYLHAEANDPREALVVRLLEVLGTDGSICVYSSYEQSILERLAERYPSMRSDLKRVIRRLWDLFPVIRDHYYHPAFGGSYSIKAVLAAVVPSLDYSDLTIQEGGSAAQEYYRMVFKETDWVERASIRQALLEYCQRDTLAMMALRRGLREKAEG